MTTAAALLVTSDDALLDDILRLAAAAGVTLDVAHDSAAAMRAWGSASLVLVGADQAATMAGRQPVRRDQVHLVSPRTAPDDLFRAALAIGAANVVELPAAEAWLVELLTDVADGRADAAVTIAVVGGSGGSGATTFAAALACTAARTRPTLLVDADPLGGGLERVVGFEDVRGLRWDALTQATGRLSSRSLRDALPGRDGLAVLGWSVGDLQPLEPFAVREVLSAAQRGNDVVVVDLPRYPDAVTAEILARSDHVVVLAALSVSAVAAVARSVGRLRQSARRIHLVTRGSSTAVDPAELADVLGIDLLATMTDQRRLEEWVDLGAGPVRARRGPLARAATAVLTRLVPPEAGAA